MNRYSLLLAAFVVQAAPVPALAQTPSAGKTVITQGALLPKRTVTISKLPSEYLEGPREQLQPLVLAYETALRNDIDTHDIQDQAALRNLYSQLSSVAQFRGDLEELKRLSSLMRPLVRNAGPMATIGVLPGILVEHRAGRHDAQWVRKEVEKRFGDLAWNDAGAVIQNMKAQIERFDPEQVRQTFRQRFDAMAREQNMVVSEEMIGALTSSRVQIDLVAPVKSSIVAGLQAVIDRNKPSLAASTPSQ